jgi:hypothetical protein
VTERIRLTTSILLAPLHANRDHVAAFERSGCDELIMIPCSSEPDQVSMLAQAVM